MILVVSSRIKRVRNSHHTTRPRVMFGRSFELLLISSTVKSNASRGWIPDNLTLLLELALELEIGTLLFYLLLLLCCVSTEPSRNLPFSLIISNVIIIPPSSWMSQKCFNLGGVVIISNVIYLRVIVIPSSSWMSPQRAPPTPCL